MSDLPAPHAPTVEPCTAPARAALPRVWQPAWRLRPAVLAGRGNRVEGRGPGAALLRLTTLFYGRSHDNTVVVGRGVRAGGLVITIEGADNRIEIGDDVRLKGRISLFGFGLRLSIGDRCDIKRCTIVARERGVVIGRDCLIAADTLIRTSDVHTIHDRAMGTAVNGPRDVVVGDGVWIAREAALLKGARVPDGCVVGFRSVLTTAFTEADCVIAGAPARVIRRGIAWSR